MGAPQERNPGIELTRQRIRRFNENAASVQRGGSPVSGFTARQTDDFIERVKFSLYRDLTNAGLSPEEAQQELQPPAEPTVIYVSDILNRPS